MPLSSDRDTKTRGPDEEHPLSIGIEDLPNKWLTKFEANELTDSDIKSEWKYFIPELFSPQLESDCLKFTYDEKLARKLLFEPIERFMYGGDPVEVYKTIQNLDSHPSLCGKVFKNGDPTYGCRDCGLDPTCVLCAECFENSCHNKHRYKISTSSGGGYCDCGDKEAWKNDVFCNVHIKGENAQHNKNILENLPKQLISRVQFVFDLVLQYAKHMLTLDDNFSLPADLEIRGPGKEEALPTPTLKELLDAYVTILYNDETHTYDQVIGTLIRAIDCSKKDAVSYATSIDREGRCIVCCSTFTNCERAKDQMSQRPSQRGISKPLKVKVVHAYIIAHQVFASRLLSWLHSILESAQAFKLVFTAIVTKDNCSIIESIFWTDTQMWKTARIQWHRLFISGMLMEIESKKTFARVFTKHYSKMMEDYIHDDHEHSVCVVSLAVQLFTMPTIALMLIAEEDVLARLLNSFLAECDKNLKNGKLHLEARQRSITQFRRIQYIFFDLKYLLGYKPDAWTSDLRKGFLHGFEKLLCLLSKMQCMDPMVRQVWQHMEFEPEWEAAFNLHIKLSSIIPLVIDWAASDQTVLIKAYRMLLKSLESQTSEDMRRQYVRELLSYSVSCIEYDVASAPVSLHLPLSRLIAGLTLKLSKYGLNYNSVEFAIHGKPTPVQLMEPVLRTRVMISQVNSGMWRRNGYSLTNQIYFYHNVRCRQEMLDRDIMLLQQEATLMDANEFLIHLLNRFNLVNWARNDPESNYLKDSDDDKIRQTVSLSEEFLTLVLVLVAERYTEGIGVVTREDCIKKEIIQLLCIEPMPHSLLDKALPDDVNHETGMENVIGEVAVFQKPSHDAKGFFKLKEQYLQDYNYFFYHYSKEDQSKSEVAQRNLKKNANQDTCCPPPIPPPFTEQFLMLVNILQCDVFLHLIKVVLIRVGDLKSKTVNESHLLIALHLIGYALHEEERFIKNDDPFFRFIPKAQKLFILAHLEFLVDEKRLSFHKNMLKWVIRRYHQVAQRTTNSQTKGMNEAVAPVPSSSNQNNAEKKRKADIMAERKARILNRMANMQKTFITKNESLFKETPSSEEASADIPAEAMEVNYLTPEDMIAVGNQQTLSGPPPDHVYTCILCHQDDNLNSTVWKTDTLGTPRMMVLGALVQRSTVLSRQRLNITHLLDPENHDSILLPCDLHWGVHVSSCGHAMHAKCWQRFFEDVLSRERRKPHRSRHLMSFDIEKGEYLCPLCNSVCNSALPLLPAVNFRIRQKNSKLPSVSNLNLGQWLQAMGSTIQMKTPVRVLLAEQTNEKIDLEAVYLKASSTMTEKRFGVTEGEDDIRPILEEIKEKKKWMSPIEYSYQKSAGGIEKPLKILKEQSPEAALEFEQFFTYGRERPYPEFSKHAKEIVNGFASAVYTHGLGVNPDLANPRIPQMVFASVAYTIRAHEETQRHMKKALLTPLSSRQRDSLTALVNFGAFSVLTVSDQPSMELSCFRFLRILLDNEYEENSLCLMEWDAFSMLVSLSLSISTLFSNAHHVAVGSEQDLFILQVTFFANIVQILMGINEDDFECRMETEDDDHTSSSDSPDGIFLQDLANSIRRIMNRSIISVDPNKLLQFVKIQCLPFLRCCGLFFHFLTEVPVSEELKSSVWVPESEYFCLLRYLGLKPHFASMFSDQHFTQLTSIWCSHPRLNKVLSNWKKIPNSSQVWTKINQLVVLPKDYSELINNVSQFPCPASIGDDSRTPAMCLICGKMLCSQSYCCQMELPEGSETMVGACTYHANFCGSGTGIFLRVRECRILMLCGKVKGCFTRPPYLDEYGEADHGLKRGNPLHLDEGSYSRLHNFWLTHSVPDNIAHTMENTNNILTMEWLHF